jgi:hypothetical protein
VRALSCPACNRRYLSENDLLAHLIDSCVPPENRAYFLAEAMRRANAESRNPISTEERSANNP